ncbi:MAG TPA: hypothetical protein VKH63_02760 [Candidatus Acidoferrum sp.]|nr:hypothetical protein [Candidatus Acidoferrum sp.]
MPRPNIIKCTGGIVLTLVGIDLYSYHVRELLVSLALFSVVFLLLALVVLAAILLWWASEQLASKTGPASRRVIAFSRRLIATYARP